MKQVQIPSNSSVPELSSQAGESLGSPPAALTAPVASGPHSSSAIASASADQLPAPTALSFDPLGRLPGEPHASYGNFRRWERDCQGMTQKDAAKYLQIPQSQLSVDMRAYYWRARAESAHLGCAFQYPDGAPPPKLPPAEPLPPDLAQLVRQREWSLALELATAAAEALRRWRESKKSPALADVTRLMELSARLARMAAGMGAEGLEVATAINNHVRVELEVALQKAYGQAPIPVQAEVRSE